MPSLSALGLLSRSIRTSIFKIWKFIVANDMCINTYKQEEKHKTELVFFFFRTLVRNCRKCELYTEVKNGHTCHIAHICWQKAKLLSSVSALEFFCIGKNLWSWVCSALTSLPLLCFNGLHHKAIYYCDDSYIYGKHHYSGFQHRRYDDKLWQSSRNNSLNIVNIACINR